jgi:hypothetical protein
VDFRKAVLYLVLGGPVLHQVALLVGIIPDLVVAVRPDPIVLIQDLPPRFAPIGQVITTSPQLD